jgi:hypothetical protein
MIEQTRPTDDYTVEDLDSAAHVLTRYGFTKIGQNIDQRWYRHPDGHVVRFELTNRYPFDIQWVGEQWELEFSLDGLLVQLTEKFD